jgi:hypothetical protein
MRKQLLAVLSFSAVSLAQVTVEGDVVLRTTGQPLQGVRVRDCTEPRLAATDPAGHFEFLGLPPVCWLGFDGPGLMPRDEPVPPNPQGPNVSMRVAMRPQAVIAGKVLDENGWPVREQVTLAQPATFGRLQQLQQVTSVRTDDLGAYRFGKLAPGRYYIQVRSTGSWFGEYQPTWYGSSAPENATPIDLKEGQEAGGIDIHLAHGGGVELSGRVTVPDGFRPSQAYLTVAWESLELIARGGSIRVGTDGSFVLRHAPPGRYMFKASTSNLSDNSVAPPYLAARTVVVGHDNVAGIVLNVVPTPIRELRGTVVFEVGAPAQVRVSMGSQWGSHGATAEVGPDGSFVLPGAWPAPYLVHAMANDGVVTSIRYGDQEILNKLEIGPRPYAELDFDGTPLPLKVTMTKTATIPGTVTDAAGRPIVRAALVFVPLGGVYGPGPGAPAQGYTGDKGAFTALQLLPGAYRVYVVENPSDIKPLMADPAFLSSQEKAFPPVNAVSGVNPPLNLGIPSK